MNCRRFLQTLSTRIGLIANSECKQGDVYRPVGTRRNALLETIVDRISSFLDVLDIKHVVLDELVSGFVQLGNGALEGEGDTQVGQCFVAVSTYIMIGDVIFEQLLLLEHVLHGREISANVIIDQLIFNLHIACVLLRWTSRSSYLAEPELDILHSSVVRLLSRGFLQLQTLVRRFLYEKLPLFDDLLQAIVDGRLEAGAFTRIDQALAHADNRLDAIRVRREFSHECLMLLTFTLENDEI